MVGAEVGQRQGQRQGGRGTVRVKGTIMIRVRVGVRVRVRVRVILVLGSELGLVSFRLDLCKFGHSIFSPFHLGQGQVRP